MKRYIVVSKFETHNIAHVERVLKLKPMRLREKHEFIVVNKLLTQFLENH